MNTLNAVIPSTKRSVIVRRTSGLTLSDGYSDGNIYVINWYQIDAAGQLFQASYSQCETKQQALDYAKNQAKILTKKYGVEFCVRTSSPTNSIR